MTNATQRAAAKSVAAKPSKADLAQREFARLLVEASRRGFHGTAGITLSIQDGHIQHLKISMERMVK